MTPRWFLCLLLLLATGAAGVAQAQDTQPTAHSSAIRYDGKGRVIATIAPDPDGAGPLGYAATRTFYDIAGLVVRVEQGELAAWQPTTVLPSAWPGFVLQQTEHRAYDSMNRLVKSWVVGSDGQIASLTQANTDRAGRPVCTATRMNRTAYPWSVPANACVLGTPGVGAENFGPDRITKNLYNAGGELVKIQKAFGVVDLQEDYATYTYSANGKQTTLTDARGYVASMTYDGHDRQTRWNFPSKTTPGVVSTTDYEEYGYDANGNRTSLRKRDGSLLTYQYDALDRMTVKVVPDRADLGPNQVRDVYYSYDLQGLQTAARYDSVTGDGVVSTYDGFGRQTGSTITLYGSTYTLGHDYDRNGNRKRLTYPDGVQVDYAYDILNRATSIVQGTTTIATIGYHSRGNRASMVGGASTAYGYDPVGRLNLLGHNPGGTAQDVNFTYNYTPSSQVWQQTRDNDAYAWSGHFNVDRTYAVNGINQYTAAGPASFCYDANGNLTADGQTVYRYDVENRLVEAFVQTNSDCAALVYAGTQRMAARYDPLGRMYMYGGNLTSPSLRFVYDGDALVAEYSHVMPRPMLKRHVHGPGVDEPLAWYEGASVATGALRRVRADHQGSVIAVTDAAGLVTNVNAYDEYGIPAAGNAGTFQYTGQMWLRDIGMYHYKARLYSPTLGRFLQTDPIGYEDQVNLYAYVGADPVNMVDPSGMQGGPAAVIEGAGVACAEVAICRTTVTKPLGDLAKTAIAAIGLRRLNERINVDTNVLINILDKPGTPNGVAALTALRGRKALISPTAYDEYTRGGKPSPELEAVRGAKLLAFVATGAGELINSGNPLRVAQLSFGEGLSWNDAEIAAAGSAEDVRTLTSDYRSFGRKVPEYVEMYSVGPQQ